MERHLGVVVGVLAENPQGRLGGAAPSPGLREQRHRAVQADGQHIVAFGKGLVGAVMTQIGAVSTEAGVDRLSRFRVLSHLARQAEQGEGHLQIEGRGVEAFGKGDPLRLAVLRVDFVALDVMAVGALADAYGSAVGVLAERTRAVGRLPLVGVRGGKGAGERHFG